MTKPKKPLFSFSAVGTIAKALTMRKSGRLTVAESKPIPEDAKSLAQLSWRHMYQKAVALWHALSALEKEEWESLARRSHMTGYAYFLSQALKPNPGLYLPLQGGTMAGDIDMDGHRVYDLPVPTANQEAATKLYVDDAEARATYTEGARVHHNAHQAIPNTTPTTLAFNTELYDTDTIHDTVTNNSRLTCKTAGKYVICASLRFAGNATGYRIFEVWLNGTIRIACSNQDNLGSTNVRETLTHIYPLIIGDYVEVKVFQNSGGPLNIEFVIAYSPVFEMQRIG